ncbi:Uncharacterised protein [Pseudomonas fragi]|uniref:Uncharacterized protein n=1 Tax=Pseudomonas fragi TaxID=296 RepID=A0A449ILK3_PSEFR|nr:Uncharacterised protein [Pseudomonas fragi]
MLLDEGAGQVERGSSGQCRYIVVGGKCLVVEFGRLFEGRQRLKAGLARR